MPTGKVSLDTELIHGDIKEELFKCLAIVVGFLILPKTNNRKFGRVGRGKDKCLITFMQLGSFQSRDSRFSRRGTFESQDYDTEDESQ